MLSTYLHMIEKLQCSLPTPVLEETSQVAESDNALYSEWVMDQPGNFGIIEEDKSLSPKYLLLNHWHKWNGKGIAKE
jgi:hypothetical protein